MREVVLVGAKRTPIGSFLGSLAPVTATQLGAAAIRAALEHAGVKPEEVQEVFMGCVLPAGLGQAPARQAALGAGLPHATPCTTVNKVCGSGLKTVVMAAQAIATGDVDIAVAGGMESMSNAPHLVQHAQWGQDGPGPAHRLDGPRRPVGRVQPAAHGQLRRAVRPREGLLARGPGRVRGRELPAGAGGAEGRPVQADEIAPVTVKGSKGDVVVDSDEEPGRGNIDKLAALRPAFDKDGTVTAGNASSLNDGGAALVLMAREVADKRGVPVLARIVAHGHHAQAPEWFTTAPAAAIEMACRRAGWKPAAVELWEINEAFAVVSLANNQMLKLDPARVNVRGGAVALGHPIGASGARILVTLLHAMARRGAKTGGASLCIGGGEGIALLVER